MPTLIEIIASSLVGGATVVSLYRLVQIWRKTKRMDEPTLDTTIERLSQDMQAQIEQRIGSMTTQDIVRAMMGRELVRQADRELMTGVEGETESIPPGVISATAMPLTTSHTRPPEQINREHLERDATRIMATIGCTWEEAVMRAERNFITEEVPPDQQLADSIERMATELVANEAIPWSEAMRRAEENHTIQGTGPLPFIDPATGRYTDRDPALVLPDATGYEREQAALPGERQSAPLLEWMLDSCRLCSQFVMTNTTIDDSEQAMLCGEEANEPCNVFGMWITEDEPSSMPPPIVYVWMDNRCPIRCQIYDPTHDLHEHAQACRACFMYAGWYHGPHQGEVDLGGMVQMAEPLPQDLEPSDVQPDARVEEARCPWMDPAFCDGCASRVPRLCPQDQAVRCAGLNEPPGQGHRCNIFHGWSLGHPNHPHLARLRSASACAEKPLIRIIRFPR